MFKSKEQVNSFITYRNYLIERRGMINLPKDDVMKMHRDHILVTKERAPEIVNAQFANTRSIFKRRISSGKFVRPCDKNDLPAGSFVFGDKILKKKLASIKEEGLEDIDEHKEPEIDACGSLLFSANESSWGERCRGNAGSKSDISR